MAGFWTEERVALASRMWGEGRSLSAISDALGAGATKNSVAGKIDRLGLMNTRARPARKFKVVEPRAKAPAGRPRAVREGASDLAWLPPARKRSVPGFDHARFRADDPFASVGGHVDIMDLAPGMCRWPFDGGAARGTGYCGEPVHASISYCGSHHALSVGMVPRPMARAA